MSYKKNIPDSIIYLAREKLRYLNQNILEEPLYKYWQLQCCFWHFVTLNEFLGAQRIVEYFEIYLIDHKENITNGILQLTEDAEDIGRLTKTDVISNINKVNKNKDNLIRLIDEVVRRIINEITNILNRIE